MADYYPLIARAVAGLEQNTGENRRVLYERARAALVAQLRSVDPPLEEADITRERLALEEAIRKVEADAAGPSRAGRVARNARARRSRRAAANSQAPTSLRDRGLRDFYQTMAEADGLGGAAARPTARRARHSRRCPATGGRRRPITTRRPTAPPRITSSRRASRPSARARARAGARRRRWRRALCTEHAEPPPPPSTKRRTSRLCRRVRSYGRLIKLVLLILVLAGLAGAAYWQREAITR